MKYKPYLTFSLLLCKHARIVGKIHTKVHRTLARLHDVSIRWRIYFLHQLQQQMNGVRGICNAVYSHQLRKWDKRIEKKQEERNNSYLTNFLLITRNYFTKIVKRNEFYFFFKIWCGKVFNADKRRTLKKLNVCK